MALARLQAAEILSSVRVAAACLMLCMQVKISAAVIAKIDLQLGQVLQRLGSCVSLDPGKASGDWQLRELFCGILQHPAVLLLKHWDPETAATKTGDLNSLRRDLEVIVTETRQRDGRKRGSQAEIKKQIQGVDLATEVGPCGC